MKIMILVCLTIIFIVAMICNTVDKYSENRKNMIIEMFEKYLNQETDKKEE